MNAKKIIAGVLTVICFVSTTGCGENKPDDMPESYYKAGVKFIEILDQVIDVEMDLETAYEETEYYVDIMNDYTDSDDLEEQVGQLAALSLTSTSSRAAIIRVSLGYGEYSIEELLEDRNSLAEDFNIKAKEL